MIIKKATASIKTTPIGFSVKLTLEDRENMRMCKCQCKPFKTEKNYQKFN